MSDKDTLSQFSGFSAEEFSFPLSKYTHQSPVLLVGATVVSWVLTHDSHAAVLVHNALTFLECWLMKWEGPWHKCLLMYKTGGVINRQV